MTKPVKRKKEVPKLEQRNPKPTIPDLVVLSLLAERPMHGYEVNATLEERQIRDWAPVSRPQIYYSLDKLLELKLIKLSRDHEPAAGPERRVFETTAKGREQLADALDAKDWIVDNVYQPFLIWLALSWQTRPGVFTRQLNARKELLLERLTRERETLKNVLAEVGHRHHEAVWMLELVIEQIEIEMRWIDKIFSKAEKRAPARNKPAR